MRASRAFAALLSIALLATACGGGDEDPAAGGEETTETGTATGTAEDEAGDTADEEADGDDGGSASTVATASTDLGEVLVDGDGNTLYMFDPDEQGPSTCTDDCAATWPPLIDEEPTAGDGVDSALLDTAAREDGSAQVTYDGWPLYAYAPDAEPGDVTGQGVNDVWWVIDPAGEPLRDTEADTGQGSDEDGDDEAMPSY